MLISFVIPCYRSENTIELVINEVVQLFNAQTKYAYEIITINDASPDKVLEKLRDISSENFNIKVVDFMQNCGKEKAVMAGLSVAKGDIAVVMDDDYQCPAYEIWRLIAPIETGDADVTTAKYDIKMESWFKRKCSDINAMCARMMLNQPKDLRIENFTAISKKVYTEMLNYRNPYPFMDALILRITKKIIAVPMEERSRSDDNSSGFTFLKSFSVFADGYTAFSIVPLRLATFMGIFTAMAGLIYLIVTIVIYIAYTEEAVPGYSSLISCVLFLGGLQMIMIGIVGEYIGRVYTCINQSPQYVIRETINIE